MWNYKATLTIRSLRVAVLGKTGASLATGRIQGVGSADRLVEWLSHSTMVQEVPGSNPGATECVGE